MSDDKPLISNLIVPGALGKNDPKKPGNDAPIAGSLERYSRNIYFYWHQFFRTYWEFHSKAEEPDADLIRRVKRDFKGALTEEFEVWWERSGHSLFANKYDDEARPVSIRKASDLRRFKNGMWVFLPFDGHFPDMIKEVRPQFEDAVEDFYLKKPRLKRKYELESTKYEHSAIRNQLTVYRAVMTDLKRSGSGNKRPLPYRRIFSQIDTSLILDRVQQEWGAAESTQFMHKNFRGACRLMYHVARGRFPCTDEPPVTYMRRRYSHGDEYYLREASKAQLE